MIKKQQGIVLLSCLIFLLLILALLRFSLNNSKVEQYKVAADTENFISREYAMLALRDAEFYLQGKSAQGTCLLTKDKCGLISSINANTSLNNDEKQQRKNKIIAEAINEKFGKVDSGIYNLYDYTSSSANVAASSCVQGKIEFPFWQCVNWSPGKDDYFHGKNIDKKYSSISYGQYTLDASTYSALKRTFLQKQIPMPRYIIEVIDGSKFGQPDRRLARVTAVGYGRIGDDGEISNTMLQSTYLIP